MVVDHDYALGCFLHYLGLQKEVNESWSFKGGTSLQKCHFGDYRFSEDLDFTISTAMTSEGLLEIVSRARIAMQEGIGITTERVAPKVDLIEDDYGKESFEARVYYKGPGNFAGSDRAIRIHVSRGELISFPIIQKRIIHPYSDIAQLPAIPLRAYTLEEAFVEKLRAFSGQRKHAISRDIFDLYYLEKRGVDVERAISAFPAKCLAQGIDASSLTIDGVQKREHDYRLNWERNLEYLVPGNLKVPFGDAWGVALDSLRRALKH
jgi:predicted nucleotidyltransferase component of viral defense system